MGDERAISVQTLEPKKKPLLNNTFPYYVTVLLCMLTDFRFLKNGNDIDCLKEVKII